VGDRLEVLRGGQVIAQIEVIFAAERSASAKVLTERAAIQPGDRARLIGEAAPPPQPAEVPDKAPADAPEPSPAPPSSTGERLPERERYRLSSTRVSGAVTFDWESFSNGSDGSDEERGFDRTIARLSLRVRDIAGTPLQLRLRARSLDVSRDRELTGGLPESDSRDRLYEAALIYDEPDGRFAVRAGRLGTSPFVGLGYLDGVLAEVRPGAGFAVGGLYGRRPDLEELGFRSTGEKLGAFIRFEPPAGESRGQTERDLGVLIAGIREEGDLGVSREYVTLESRFGSGARWSFFQHAEVDLNTDWREERATDQTQLSVLSLTALGRITSRGRLAITYDRFERYFTEEDRFLPEELFDRLWRQGLRVSWQTGRSEGLNLSLQAGLRRREEGVLDPRLGLLDSRETYSFGLGVHHPRLPGLGLSAGGNVLGFSSDSAEGLLVTARAGRRLGAGHEISVSLGGNAYRTVFEEERTLAWGRATLWLELPLDLFGQAEVELLRGDEDLEGQRLRLGLGYRF
ncbi:MAG TPA: hypothetical protein VE685_06960, partial [Thermoanaerobaculia bacterium]|nr:hypothetical protein [Thermoanaerobaculia bacterium]